MATNLFVGNLPFTTDSNELEQLFTPYGSVSRAQVITDRDTGRSRGFGFVEMDSDEEAQKAIDALDGSDIDGRQIKVNVARERSR
ncbi:MAG TPA: RNA-binding protein [Acidimicrobiia bacterium]|nr:RNA-binding protein [Acidimicrobiia bacterium]